MCIFNVVWFVACDNGESNCDFIVIITDITVFTACTTFINIHSEQKVVNFIYPVMVVSK